MAFIEFQFPSANGQDTVWGWKVTPLGAPKATVQLIHGYGVLNQYSYENGTWTTVNTGDSNGTVTRSTNGNG